MRRVSVKKADEVEIKPFVLETFIDSEEINDTMKNVTKKELKNLAESLGMTYTEEEIIFAKKLIVAYTKREK